MLSSQSRRFLFWAMSVSSSSKISKTPDIVKSGNLAPPSPIPRRVCIYDIMEKRVGLRKFHKIMIPKYEVDKPVVIKTESGENAYPIKYFCARLMYKTDILILSE